MSYLHKELEQHQLNRSKYLQNHLEADDDQQAEMWLSKYRAVLVKISRIQAIIDTTPHSAKCSESGLNEVVIPIDILRTL